MKIQYRIAYRGAYEWYAQVRLKKWLFWSSWKRIARYNDGFGLYDVPEWSYPLKSKGEAQQLIIDFDVWRTSEQEKFTVYTPYYTDMRSTQ